MIKTRPTLITAVLLAATGALAQEAAPAQQQVDAAWAWTGMDLSVMPMGEGQEAYVTETFVVISDAEGPLAGLVGRCLTAGTSDLTTMGYQLAGTCVYQDAGGNQLWERVEDMSDGSGASMTGKGIWIGGTGRFEGASGEGAYASTFVGSPRAGVYQGTGTKAGILILPAN